MMNLAQKVRKISKTVLEVKEKADKEKLAARVQFLDMIKKNGTRFNNFGALVNHLADRISSELWCANSVDDFGVLKEKIINYARNNPGHYGFIRRVEIKIKDTDEVFYALEKRNSKSIRKNLAVVFLEIENILKERLKKETNLLEQSGFTVSHGLYGGLVASEGYFTISFNINVGW